MIDPKIQEAKNILLQLVEKFKKEITGVRPTSPEKKEISDKLLEEFNKMRGAPLFFPYLGTGRGNGPFVELIDGSIKYDFITGIGVHGLGHCHPVIISAAIDAALDDVLMQGHLQQNEEVVTLTKLLLKESGMDHCFLTSSGAMAVENGLKICLQKQFPATRILAFEHCFAGRTLATATITDKPEYRIGLPEILAVDYIPFYDPLRPEESIKAAERELKNHLSRYPKQHAVMIVELIQGEGGVNVGSKSFFERLFALVKGEEIPILIDEVQTFGRTSRLFAYQHFGLEKYADLVTFGKLSQVCGTLYKPEYLPKPGLLSQTFIGSSSAIVCARVIIEKLLTENVLGENGKNMQINLRFSERLEAIRKANPQLLNGPYGLGSMVSFTPFDGEKNRVVAFVKELFQRGVITFIAGANPTRCRMLPPALVLEPSHIDQGCQLIEETLKL